MLEVLCKRTEDNHKFECCFLGGQVSSNGFKVFMVAYTVAEPFKVQNSKILSVCFQNNFGILCFKKKL